MNAATGRGNNDMRLILAGRSSLFAQPQRRRTHAPTTTSAATGQQGHEAAAALVETLATRAGITIVLR